MATEVSLARSRLGVAARRRDERAIAQARRELAVANIVQFIGRALSDAPPLRREDRRRIADAVARKTARTQ